MCIEIRAHYLFECGASPPQMFFCQVAVATTHQQEQDIVDLNITCKFHGKLSAKFLHSG